MWNCQGLFQFLNPWARTFPVVRLSRQKFGTSFQPPWAVWQPPLLLGAPLQGVFKDRIWSILDAFDFRPFPQTEGREKQSWTCGCQAIFSRSAWSLRGCGGHITCGPQSWLGKSGCSFWGCFATQNVSHAVATPTDFNGCKFLSPIATVRNSLLKSSAHRKLVPSGAHWVRGELFPFCLSCSFFFTLLGTC